MRCRTALRTLCILAGLISVPVVLTWRQVRQEQLNHALIVAIKSNDSRAVLEWLQRGANANARDMVPAANTSVSLWTRFLRLLRVHRASSSGKSALSLAFEEMIGDHDRRNANGLILRALIEHGADPNQRDSDGQTPLCAIASENGMEQQCGSLVRLLLDKRADPLARDGFGYIPLTAAASARQLEAVRALVARVGKTGVDTRDGDGAMALIDAAWDGNKDDPTIVRLLLEAGADPNAQDNSGYTALWKATFNDSHAGWSSPQVMRCLLAHGAQVRRTKMEDLDLLEWAAKGKKVKAMRVLIDAGAAVNERGPDGLTPLITAVKPPDYASWGRPANCVRLLLARGADPNLGAADGRTPLQVARANGEADVLRLLRQAGARK